MAAHIDVLFTAYCALVEYRGSCRGEAKGTLTAYLSRFSSAKAASTLQSWSTKESESVDEIGKWAYCNQNGDIVLVRDVATVQKGDGGDDLLRSPQASLAS